MREIFRMYDRKKHTWLSQGLSEWAIAGGQVEILSEDGVRVPRVVAPGLERDGGKQVGRKPAVVFLGGQHLEEDSGVYVLSQPELFNEWRIMGVTCVVYPCVNQYGLGFPRHADEKCLRENESGANYNSYWGVDIKKKAIEVRMIERDVMRLSQHYLMLMSISLHEDSESPAKGYLYASGFGSGWLQVMPEAIVANLDGVGVGRTCLRDGSRYPFGENQVVHGGMILDEEDDSFEHWMAKRLWVPSVTVEAPFAAELTERVQYQTGVMSALRQLLIESMR